MPSIVMPFITPAHARQFNTELSISAGSRVVMIGTSLTDNGFRDHEESVHKGLSARGGYTWARVLTDQNMEWMNVGIGGNTIEDMMNRYDIDVAPLEPDYVLFDAGTNDASKTFAEYVISLNALYSKAESHGAIAIPMEIPMRESNQWNDSIRDKILQVNEWIRDNYPNAIDSNKYFMSPITERPYPNYTVDGTHWNNEGAYQVNRSIVETFNVSGSQDIIGTPANTNATMNGTSGSLSGGVTGTSPDGHNVDIISGAPTVIASANNPGFTLQITPSGTAGDERIFIYGDAIDIPLLNQYYELISKLQASDWDGWKSIQIRLNRRGHSDRYSYDLKDDVSDGFWPDDALINETTLRTSPIFATPDTTRFQFTIEITVKGNAVGTGLFNTSLLQVQEYSSQNYNDIAATFPDIESGFRANQVVIDYNSSTQINALYGKHGKVWDKVSTNPEYNASLFGNRGGIQTTSTTQRLITSADIPANGIVYGVFETSVTPSAHCDIFMFGTTDVSDANSARLVMLSSNGNIRYYNNEGATAGSNGGSSINLGGDYKGQRVAYIVEFKNGVADFYINDGSTPIISNGNIFDGYINRERLIMGGGNTYHAEMWLSHATFDSVDITPEELMNDLKSRWGI